MKKIITISREYGSGGRLIGKLVAESLGYDFYDKEIIDMAAQESGLSPDFIKKTEGDKTDVECMTALNRIFLQDFYTIFF